MATSPGLQLRLILSLLTWFLGLWDLKEHLPPFKTWSNITKSLSINVSLTETTSDFPFSISCFLHPPTSDRDVINDGGLYRITAFGIVV